MYVCYWAVSVIELLPKDKKAKEEKINIIGQVTIDLMPLLTGLTEVQGAHRLIAPNPPSQADQVEVDVILRVTLPFVDKAEVNSRYVHTYVCHLMCRYVRTNCLCVKEL